MTAPDAAQLDVFLSGTVFLDLVFTGLRAPPAAETEIFSAGLGSAVRAGRPPAGSRRWRPPTRR